MIENLVCGKSAASVDGWHECLHK